MGKFDWGGAGGGALSGAAAGSAVMPGIGTLIGGALGAVGGGLGSKKRKVETIPQWQRDLQRELATGSPYGGKFAAEMSPYEKTGLEDWLAPYLEAPATGKTFAAGEEELGKVLRGEYDPRTSPYYAGLKTESMTNLEDVIDQIRGQKAAGGEFFTSERIGEEQKAGRGVAESLNTMLGELFEKERARTFAALPIAMQYDQYATTTAPMAKVSAATTFGALPRLIEQRELEGKYQDFVRQKKQQMGMAGLAPSTGYAPSPFQDLMGTLGPILGGLDLGKGKKTTGTTTSPSGKGGAWGAGGSIEEMIMNRRN